MRKTNKTSSGKSVSAIPEGFHTVTPYLVAKDAAKLIEFIEKAFSGDVTFIQKDHDGKVMHATVKIGDAHVMISDQTENMQPETAMLFLYVEDADAVYQKAIDANAKSIREPKDEFYGDRASAVKDAWNNTWWIATHIEDVSREELKRRSEEKEQQHVDA